LLPRLFFCALFSQVFRWREDAHGRSTFEVFLVPGDEGGQVVALSYLQDQGISEMHLVSNTGIDLGNPIIEEQG